MAWRDVADRLNQSVVRTFGETVTFTPLATGVSETATIHFESAFFQLDTETQTGLSVERPHAYIRLADLSVTHVEPGDLITAQGQAYEVVDGEPDGYGAIRIWLREKDA